MLFVLGTAWLGACDKDADDALLAADPSGTSGGVDVAPTPMPGVVFGSIEELYAQPSNAAVKAALRQVYTPEPGTAQSFDGAGNVAGQPFAIDSLTPFSDFVPWVDYGEDGSVRQLHFIHYNRLTDEYVARTVTRELLSVAALADTAAIWPAEAPLSYTELVYAFRYAELWRLEESGGLAPRECWHVLDMLGLCDLVPCPKWAKEGGIDIKININLSSKCSGGTKETVGGSTAGNYTAVTFIPAGPGLGSSGTLGSGGSGSAGPKPGDANAVALTAFKCELRRCGWAGALGTLACTTVGAMVWEDMPNMSPLQVCGMVVQISTYSTPTGLNSVTYLPLLHKIFMEGKAQEVTEALKKPTGRAYEADLIACYNAVGLALFDLKKAEGWIKFMERVKRASALGEADLSGDNLMWLRNNEQVLAYAERNRGKFGNYQLKNIVDYVRFGEYAQNISLSLKELDEAAAAWEAMLAGRAVVYQPEPVVPDAPTILSIRSSSEESVSNPVVAWNDRERLEVIPQDLRVDGPLDKVLRHHFPSTTHTLIPISHGERISDFRNLLKLFTYNPPGSRDYRAVADRNFATFTKPQSTVIDVSDATLKTLIASHPVLRAYINNSLQVLQRNIRQSGSLNGLSIVLNREAPICHFNQESARGSDRWAGPTILMNNTESAEWRVKAYSITPTSWSATLHLTITDHFGMDEPDMLKFRIFHRGFESWYWLQHGEKWRPFRTRLYYDIVVTGKF